MNEPSSWLGSQKPSTVGPVVGMRGWVGSQRELGLQAGVRLPAAGPLTAAFFNPALAASITFHCSGHTLLQYAQVYWLGPLTGKGRGVPGGRWTRQALGSSSHLGNRNDTQALQGHPPAGSRSSGGRRFRGC